MTKSKLWHGAWLAAAATVATPVVTASAQTPRPGRDRRPATGARRR